MKTVWFFSDQCNKAFSFDFASEEAAKRFYAWLSDIDFIGAAGIS